MKITLVGMGSGTPGNLTVQGLNALREAELIIGARRLLENLPDGCTGNRAPLYKIEEICALLRTTEAAHVAVAYSGDTGFYSGASALCRALDAAGLPYMVCPGLSSVQLLAAALGRPWQDWKLVSAHGCACTPALVCSADTPTFFMPSAKPAARSSPTSSTRAAPATLPSAGVIPARPSVSWAGRPSTASRRCAPTAGTGRATTPTATRPPNNPGSTLKARKDAPVKRRVLFVYMLLFSLTFLCHNYHI